jgi:hypothetical protein
MSWNPSTDPSVVGYNIHFGVSSGNYTNSVSVGNVTNATVTGLVAGQAYYFAATAVNAGSVESDYSNEIWTNAPAPANTPPVAQSSSVTTPEGQSVAVTLTGTDADGNSLTYAVLTSPANGTLSGTAPNLTYTPSTYFFGTDSFTFRVNDGFTNSAPATVTITVTPVNNQPTLAAIANLTLGANPGPQTVGLTGIGSGAPNENQTLTVTASSSNTGLIPTPTVTYTSPNTTGSISFTPVANASGSAQISVTVNDGQAVNNTITRTFTVSVSQPAPAITLTAPANGSSYSAPANIGLSASVTANGNTLNKVQFYNGTTLLGEVTNAPYNFTWNSAPAGTYTLKARLVYNTSGLLDSGTATVTVTNLPPPAIALTAPANGASYTAPATIGLSAGVTGNGNTLNKVQFYNGTTLLGEVTNAPYNFTWNSAPVGTYTLKARLVYNTSGLLDSATATVTVTNPAPTIALTSPANGGVYTAPANISLAASVTANGHTVNKVQFLNGSTVLGEATSAPFTVGWSNVAAGNYSVVARLVYDTTGQLDSTPAARITVAASRATNTPPVISPIANQVAVQGTPLAPIPFTIGDAETSASSLILSATSDTPGLLPATNIVFGGSDSNRTVTLTPLAGATGTVAVTVFVTDGSLTNNSSFLLTVVNPAPVIVTTVGSGTVWPNVTHQTFIAGNTYTLVAVPDAGQDFAGWSGSFSSSSPQLTFTWTSNLVLQATFTTDTNSVNAAAVAGTYSGLFYQTDAIRLQSAGSFTIVITPSGAYSGKIQVGFTGKYSVSGHLNAGGQATNVFAGRGGVPFNLEFRVVSGPSGGQLSGALTDGNWLSILTGDQAMTYTKAKSNRFIGDYTLSIPGNTNDVGSPVGDGFGTVRVNSAGRVAFVGTLADGTKVSQSAPVSQSGYWPLYASIYSGRGSVISWLSFPTQAGGDLKGAISWIKLAGAANKTYMDGFSSEHSAIGSLYVRPAAGQGLLDFASANLIFAGGSLGAGWTNSVTLHGSQGFSVDSKSLKLTFSPGNGTFRGMAHDPATGKPLTFSGAVLQKFNTASGFLLDNNLSSRVSLAE